MAQKGKKGEKGDNFGELEVKVRQNKSQIHNWKENERKSKKLVLWWLSLESQDAIFFF